MVATHVINVMEMTTVYNSTHFCQSFDLIFAIVSEDLRNTLLLREFVPFHEWLRLMRPAGVNSECKIEEISSFK